VLWAPKENNCERDKNHFDKSFFNDDKNHKSLLYQISHDVLNSIPGMNSFEFFNFPSSHKRRTLQVEVVHLKDLKAAAASSSASSLSISSNETSDLNDGMTNELGNLSHNEMTNGDSNNSSTTTTTTIHIQKIGQTSISQETDVKTLQTAYGNVIKNAYLPNTITRIEKDSGKMTKDKKHNDFTSSSASSSIMNKNTNNNVKIIACSSQQLSGDMSKSVNKNQTLINMLTQQVVMPTNSNRHYIITSASKASDVKMENNAATTVISTNQIRKNANHATTSTSSASTFTSTGQSQLVQILNSPPSNFTMKPLNVISSASVANAGNASVSANQIISTPTGSIENLKADLPNSVKQQGIVQFICKTDGKIIHLTPICNNSGASGVTKKITYKVDTSGAKGPTILHHANQQIILNNQLRKGENPNILTIIQKQSGDDDKKIPGTNKNAIVATSSSSISTRSIYEENYAKFIQAPPVNSASDMGLLTISSTPISSSTSCTNVNTTNTFIQKIGKTVIQSSNQILPKFNQAFGKSIFSSSSALNDANRTKVSISAKETPFLRSNLSNALPLTKITATKNEKAEGTLMNLLESDDKSHSLPTLHSALQGNNLLYARPIGNGKLIASNNNNVLLTAIRNNNTQSNNVRIITSLADSLANHSNSNNNRTTLMAPVRISVPIQIPQLINSVRPQAQGTTFRPQIVIATTPTSSANRVQQSNMQNIQTASKLESLLMGAHHQQQLQQQQQQLQQQQNQQQLQQSASDVECENIKIEQKPKKNVDNSTLEQLREFDMVLEQVLERSSVTPNSVASPPQRSDNDSPRKTTLMLSSDSKLKTETKSCSSSMSVTSNSPNDSPTSSKSIQSCSSSSAGGVKTVPKLQEDEHTAQRILDILANYKEQVRNSPDLNNKPAPRRRANPPTNPPAKRKKMASSSGNMKSSKQFGSSSDVMTDTMGSEDSSCGVGSGVASTGSINTSPRGDIDDHTDVSMDNNFYMEDVKKEIALSPQSSSSSIATSPAHNNNKFTLNRRLVMTESKSNSAFTDSSSSKSLIISNSQSSSASSASSVTRTSTIGESIERLNAQGSTATAVLMPGNYILPMNVLKSGQQLAILSSNNGQKIIAVPASQLSSPVLTSNTSGTSIILQRYVNQLSGNANNINNHDGGDKSAALLTQTNETIDENQQQPQKSIRLQRSNISLINNTKQQQTTSSTLYIKAIEQQQQPQQERKVVKQENVSHDGVSSNSFVSDKTLITEIIQQQQQLAHNHPQHNFMIKLNEPSDPRSSSSIMFMSNDEKITKIKSEKLDFDGCIKEEIMDLNNDHEILSSPMLNTKIELDDNTCSNQGNEDMNNPNVQKIPQFQSILNSCLTKNSVNSINASSRPSNSRGFLIDPSSKILMYSDRKQMNVADKDIFNPKSFSEECADLGVDEPIASDLFPEADLLFVDSGSGSPKFDHPNAHNDGGIQIKQELENGEVLLQMNYNHNITEPSWLNFDTEDELVESSHCDSGDDIKSSEGLGASF
jgi:hypothetical protein